jgi:hypothetical protein
MTMRVEPPMGSLEENGGMCEYCQQRPATQGDHFTSTSEWARRVNDREVTLREAIEDANAAENIVGSCGGKGGCNQIKGAKQPSSTPGEGRWVPPDPTPKVQNKIEVEELIRGEGSQ